MAEKPQSRVFRSGKSRRGSLIAAIALVLLMMSAPLSLAQTPAEEPCDQKYYDSLEARAWLEAQREITQNQNLIFKPDSVLEYTCYDLYLSELADHAIDMFSETTRWGTILPDTSMDDALENLIGPALRQFLQQNFDHKFLGGRGSIDYTPQTKIQGGTYSCDKMNAIWMEAKCMDFIDIPKQDGFFTFEEYAQDDDKRQLPKACAKVSTWQDNINVAWIDGTTPWEEDDVKTYLEWLEPGACDDPDYSSAIPTGLTVRTKEGDYPEKVCLRPGCHYDRDRCVE